MVLQSAKKIGHEGLLGSHWTACAMLKVLYEPIGNWVWWFIPVITALWRMRQEDCKTKASPGCVASLDLKQNKNKKETTGEFSV